MTTAVQFTDVSRHYGEVRAVDAVSIEIRDGEFFIDSVEQVWPKS